MTHFFLFFLRLNSCAVYDVTSKETFDALPTWFNELETFTSSPDVVKIIVGNKVDKVGRVFMIVFRGRNLLTILLLVYRNTLESSLQKRAKPLQKREGVYLSSAVQRKVKV